MLIVLEGVDGAGKSTLADRLVDHLGEGCLQLHSGPLKGDPLQEYELRLKDYRPGTGQHVVADRWHVGELIYGPLYRGVSKLTMQMRRHVEMYLDKLGAHKLIVSAPYETIQTRLRTRGEDFLQSNHVGMVWDFYNEYAYLHDWGVVASDQLLDYIVKVARRRETEASRLVPFRSYVGPIHPKHLLLGDVAETPSHNRPAYDSAFVPYPDSAGHYLLGAVETTNVSQIGFANATQEDVHALWYALGRPNVVALGAAAERAARDVPHRTAGHPAEVKRRGDQPKQYGLEIKELLS